MDKFHFSLVGLGDIGANPKSYIKKPLFIEDDFFKNPDPYFSAILSKNIVLQIQIFFFLHIRLLNLPPYLQYQGNGRTIVEGLHEFLLGVAQDFFYFITGSNNLPLVIMEKYKALQFLEEHILLIKKFSHLLVLLLSSFGVL